MVHWPEVIMTYDSRDKALFSADAFGKFGANDYDDPEGWACEARRYYFGIVGKYGAQVQAVLKKLAGLEIQIICPLHGPVLTEDIAYYLETYNTWSSYGVESEGVAVCYTTVYGHTREAAELLAEKLRALGCPKVAVTDLAREDIHEAVEDAFRYGKLVLASTSYDAGVFPIMKDFIERLTEHNYQNRLIGIIENGSWAPSAARTMKALFDGCKNITFAETTVTIKSALRDDSLAQIDALAAELMK
jgi:flavorubredoxin